MAKSIALLAFGLLALAGCQQQAMVETFPSANFNGPVVKRPAPRQVAVAPRPMPAKSDVPREWIPAARANSWQWIVIHHSATSSGGAAAFDRMHRAKGWDELGYHFVIGNGTETRNGQIEVGSRWPKQKWGAHTKTPDNRYNNFGIGICLVGNFDNTRPTPQQMQSVSKLVSYLMKTYHIPPGRVIGHGDTKPTDCPGRNMSVAQVRQMSTRILADSGSVIEDTRTAAAEMLFEPTAR